MARVGGRLHGLLALTRSWPVNGLWLMA